MKYKSIMLDVKTYSRLAEAKETLEKKMGGRVSFNELLLELASRDLEFLGIDDLLKRYIRAFTNKVTELKYVVGVLLYGSVTRGTCGQYSDIDIMVLTNQKGSNSFFELVDIAGSLKEDFRKELMEKKLPSLISPVVLSDDKIKNFSPFYLDLADYGIILYEKNGSLSDFIYSVKKIKHKREMIEGIEVLTWK